MIDSTTATCVAPDDRPLRPALWRGWCRKCPNCGQGKLLHSYLKVNHTCSECGEVYEHHRADDGPAYLTILIVGHLMAPLLHIYFSHVRPGTIHAVHGFCGWMYGLVPLPSAQAKGRCGCFPMGTADARVRKGDLTLRPRKGKA